MGKSNKTTQTNSAQQPFLGAYQSTLGQAQQVAGQPLQQYGGNIVQPFSPLQNQGFGIVGNAAGNTGSAVADPYFAQAQQDFGAATTPLWSNVDQFSPDQINKYELPYTQDVVNATQKQFDLSNQEGQTQLAGNTAAAGAFGGDRQAVAQAELAKQQNATQAPVIAGLENQGYTQALGEFNNQQAAQLGANEANSWLNSQAAFGESSLGSEAQNAAFTGASQLNAAGGEQQALGQENLNVPYEQFLAQQAYPFQTTSWLTGQETGLGGAAGSTSTTTQNTNLLSQILGGLMSGAGAVGASGGFGSNGWLTGNQSTSAASQIGNMFGASPVAVNPSSFSGQWTAPGGARGGAINRITHGGRGIANVIPFPMHRVGRGIGRAIGGTVPNVDVDIVPNAPNGPMGGPPKANAQPSQGGGINLGQVAQLAAMAGGMRRGGLVHRDPGV